MEPIVQSQARQLPLKSKHGCLTCIRRRKKCDERAPVCGDCYRLHLRCVQRVSTASGALSMTSIRGRSNSIVRPLSHGYPAFEDSKEHMFTLQCPDLLRLLVSAMAGTSFRDLSFFVTASLQNVLVRKAAVAFTAAFNMSAGGNDNLVTCIHNYQSCVQMLRTTISQESGGGGQRQDILICCMLLGLLEALNLGGLQSTLLHFAMCNDILTECIQQDDHAGDATLVKLYRMAAECIMFNSATLSLYHRDGRTKMWDERLSSLFEGGAAFYSGTSPFLGGFHEVYALMLRMTLRAYNGAHELREDEYRALSKQLDDLEQIVPIFYDHMKTDPPTVRLYQSKFRLHIASLRVLLKRLGPAAQLDEGALDEDISMAVRLLQDNELLEGNNPALCWPLQVLACSARRTKERQVLLEQMEAHAKIIDAGNSRRLMSVVNRLKHGKPVETVEDEYSSDSLLGMLLDGKGAVAGSVKDD